MSEASPGRRAAHRADRMDAQKTGERTGSRPQPPEAGARSASLEPGRAPGYLLTSQLLPRASRMGGSGAAHGRIGRGRIPPPCSGGRGTARRAVEGGPVPESLQRSRRFLEALRHFRAAGHAERPASGDGRFPAVDDDVLPVDEPGPVAGEKDRRLRDIPRKAGAGIGWMWAKASFTKPATRSALEPSRPASSRISR